MTSCIKLYRRVSSSVFLRSLGCGISAWKSTDLLSSIRSVINQIKATCGCEFPDAYNERKLHQNSNGLMVLCFMLYFINRYMWVHFVIFRMTCLILKFKSFININLFSILYYIFLE